MKTILIDDIQYTFADSWNEINLGKMMAITELQQKQHETEMIKNVEMVHLITNIPKDLLMDVPLEDFKIVAGMFEWISLLPDENKVIAGVNIDGQKYIPIDLNTMTTGDWISIEVFQNRPDKEENIDKLAAILIRPEVDGKIEPLKDLNDINRRAELFKEKLMVGDYWPIVQSFFDGAVSSSLNNLEAYSDRRKSRLKVTSF